MKKEELPELRLGNRLKEIRKERDLWQKDIADMFGLAHTTVAAIEEDRYEPSVKLALAICKAFDKKVEEVFYLE